MRIMDGYQKRHGYIIISGPGFILVEITYPLMGEIDLVTIADGYSSRPI